MEFTLENIEEAGRKYTGVEFYKLVLEFVKMGIVENVFNIRDGVRVYENQNGHKINIDFVEIAVIGGVDTNKNIFENILKQHQQGNTDFMTFCKEVGEVGVYKWVIDTNKMTCSYYDTLENVVWSEEINIPK